MKQYHSSLEEFHKTVREYQAYRMKKIVRTDKTFELIDDIELAIVNLKSCYYAHLLEEAKVRVAKSKESLNEKT